MTDLRTELTHDELRTAWRWIADESYWGKAIPWAVFERACRGSICFGLFEGERLAAFGRVVTDGATFAWLCDVFVDAESRGCGLGKSLMEGIMAHPEVQDLRRWGLATADAHGLYAQYGFEPADPLRHMEKVDRDIYPRLSGSIT
ncbi:GNAT superfamily N-acetyltransferase [Brevundimonas alba]|uniref:GNAT superfamily N-acetyltransferase n=1 Tax=Brevundimonas alba TaxID=74314 RepID=A0A7X5YHQ8_9CAUL|nr:GNAT family N-acetyltransferase [Brevundimonas alba]NJC40185.1 GNAT superfamily N-acetyltransferase [Brevundimonas alba]